MPPAGDRLGPYEMAAAQAKLSSPQHAASPDITIKVLAETFSERLSYNGRNNGGALRQCARRSIPDTLDR